MRLGLIILRTQAQALTYLAKATSVLMVQHALATDAEHKLAPATCGVLVTNPPTAWEIKNPAVTAVRQHGTAALGAPAPNPPAAPAQH